MTGLMSTLPVLGKSDRMRRASDGAEARNAPLHRNTVIPLPPLDGPAHPAGTSVPVVYAIKHSDPVSTAILKAERPSIFFSENTGVISLPSRQQFTFSVRPVTYRDNETARAVCFFRRGCSLLTVGQIEADRYVYNRARLGSVVPSFRSPQYAREDSVPKIKAESANLECKGPTSRISRPMRSVTPPQSSIKKDGRNRKLPPVETVSKWSSKRCSNKCTLYSMCALKAWKQFERRLPRTPLPLLHTQNSGTNDCSRLSFPTARNGTGRSPEYEKGSEYLPLYDATEKLERSESAFQVIETEVGRRSVGSNGVGLSECLVPKYPVMKMSWRREERQGCASIVIPKIIWTFHRICEETKAKKTNLRTI